MNESRYEIFDQYLNNELNIDQKNNFENKLNSDVEMSESFDIYKNLNGFMANKFQNEIQLNEFKENLKTVSQIKKTEHETKVFSIKPVYYAVAASLVLIFGLMIFNNSRVPTYQDFNSHENAFFTERGDVIKDLKMAQDAFNSKKFAEAVPLFKKILKTYTSPEIEYFYGISLLENNKFYEAEMVFNKLKTGKSLFKTKAVWNLALLKLKQKDLNSCKEILQTIPQDFEDYNQVDKLLKSLD